MTVFGVPWERLGLADVERFLADAETEPLLWEAKGTEVNRHHVRENVCAFGNGNEPGFLILGASRQDGEWNADGVVLPDEAPVWVGMIVRDDVRPAPAIDTKSWSVGEGGGRVVAVVRVPPCPTPPCITRGTVYERVGGSSQSVRDPIRLADLYRRGDAARQAAEQNADWAAGSGDSAMGRFPRHQADRVRFSIGIARAAHPPDIASRLFTMPVEELIRGEIGQLASGDGILGGPPIHREWTQHTLAARTAEHDDRRPDVLIEAHWNGAVDAGILLPATSAGLQHLVDERIAPAWAALARLLGKLDATGPAYATAKVCEGALPHQVILKRGPMDDLAFEPHRDRVLRELERAAGYPAFEP